MSRIRSKDTKPEMVAFRYLRANGVYFQKHYLSKEKINIDIALPRKKKAVFIDGDFWHGNTFERRKDSLPNYWTDKIIRNIKRDKKYRTLLRSTGWQVLRIWESELMKKSSQDNALGHMKHFLLN